MANNSERTENSKPQLSGRLKFSPPQGIYHSQMKTVMALAQEFLTKGFRE